MQAAMGGRRGRGNEPMDIPMPEEREERESDDEETEPQQEKDDTYKIWFDAVNARDGADGEESARLDMLTDEALKDETTSDTPETYDADPEAINGNASDVSDVDAEATQNATDDAAPEATNEITVVDYQLGPNALPQVVEKPVEKHQNTAQLLFHQMDEAAAKKAAEVTTTESPAARAAATKLALEKLTVQPHAPSTVGHEIRSLSRWVLLSFGIIFALVATGTVQILGARRRKAQTPAPDIMETEGY